MNSIYTSVFPITSFFFLIQNIFRKNRSVFARFAFGIPALAMFIVDLFVYLIFYFNCSDARVFFKDLNCIGAIYPTADFMVFSVLSVVMLVITIAGMKNKWERGKYYLAGSAIIYLGLCARLFVLITSSEAISQNPGTFNPVVLEIFSIAVVYGMISSIAYLLVYFMGIAKS